MASDQPQPLAGASGIIARLLDLVEIDRLFSVAPGRELAVLALMDGLQQSNDGWRAARRRLPR
jgi:hypothetical protein